MRTKFIDPRNSENALEVFVVVIIIATLALLICFAARHYDKPETPAYTQEESMLIFPKVFTDESFEYDTSDPNVKAMALADGLTGWGNCHAKAPIPRTFGNGMVKVGEVLGIIPTDENLMQYARLIESGKLSFGRYDDGQPSSQITER